MKESHDMPRYLKISLNKPATQTFDSSTLWINGKSPQKVYFPERVTGVSRDFPTNFRLSKELTNPFTAHNPFIDEQEVLSNQKQATTWYRKMLRTKTVNGRLTNRVPGLLLRNTEKSVKRFVEHNSTVDSDQINSVSALRLLQNYNVKEASKPSFRTFIKWPQKRVKVRNPVSDQDKDLQPPPVQFEAYSRFKSNYMKMYECIPKAFNRKKGLLSFYAERKFYKEPEKVPPKENKSEITTIRTSKSVPRTFRDRTVLLTERRETPNKDLSSLRMSGEKQKGYTKKKKMKGLELLLREVIMMRSRGDTGKKKVNEGEIINK